jgi:hypothetical protein
MAKRRSSQVQRRPRATEQAMTRRIGAERRVGLDWRIIALVGAVVVAIGVVGVALLISGPNQWRGTFQRDEGRRHVAVGTFPTYQSVPPTSGNHWSSPSPQCPAPWGVYSTPVQEPCVVHNLEHGGIVIWYQQGKLSDDQVQQLANFVRTQVSTPQFKFILTPYSGKDFGHPIAVTAWDWLLYLDDVNTDAIRSFANEHYERSPEPNGGPAAPAG